MGAFGDNTRAGGQAGILRALRLANRHLEHKTEEMLEEWAICQLFNGIRGLLFCNPFEGTNEQETFRHELAGLAWKLLVALKIQRSWRWRAARSAWKGGRLLPYAPILLGLPRTHRERLVEFDRSGQSLNHCWTPSRRAVTRKDGTFKESRTQLWPSEDCWVASPRR